jgi:hypothetical protein
MRLGNIAHSRKAESEPENMEKKTISMQRVKMYVIEHATRQNAIPRSESWHQTIPAWEKHERLKNTSKQHQQSHGKKIVCKRPSSHTCQNTRTEGGDTLSMYAKFF